MSRALGDISNQAPMAQGAAFNPFAPPPPPAAKTPAPAKAPAALHSAAEARAMGKQWAIPRMTFFPVIKVRELPPDGPLPAASAPQGGWKPLPPLEFSSRLRCTRALPWSRPYIRFPE